MSALKQYMQGKSSSQNMRFVKDFSVEYETRARQGHEVYESILATTSSLNQLSCLLTPGVEIGHECADKLYTNFFLSKIKYASNR
jgi:hypothetical protein